MIAGRFDELSDADFIARFERMEIPAGDFRHADHIRVAWSYLQDPDFASGAARFVKIFSRYLRHIGAVKKYHETMTWFFLVKIRESMQASPHQPWVDFARTNDDLMDPKMAMLKALYLPATLESAFARAVFVLPDRDGH